MSRVGKRVITVPQGVEVRMEERTVHVQGPKGSDAFTVPELVDVEIDGDQMRVNTAQPEERTHKTMRGTVQANLQNMVTGCSEGFTRQLQLVGVGYRASVQGRDMELSLGYSHPVRFRLPEGVEAQVEGNTLITLASHSKVLVGQAAAKLQGLRPPEPYQGKGVSYEGERIRRKAGKAGKK